MKDRGFIITVIVGIVITVALAGVLVSKGFGSKDKKNNTTNQTTQSEDDYYWEEEMYEEEYMFPIIEEPYM